MTRASTALHAFYPLIFARDYDVELPLAARSARSVATGTSASDSVGVAVAKSKGARAHDACEISATYIVVVERMRARPP